MPQSRRIKEEPKNEDESTSSKIKTEPEDIIDEEVFSIKKELFNNKITSDDDEEPVVTKKEPKNNKRIIDDDDDSTDDESDFSSISNSCEQCPICLCTLNGQDIANPDSCDHLFCLECLSLWSEVEKIFFLKFQK
jgi:hypothetical protein